MVILDKTIFHPQGGGQPNDEGLIVQSDTKFKVNLMQIKDDVIWHIGTFNGPEFQKGSNVECQVDEAKRRLFARIHSAGHLLDICMTKAGRSDLKPSKGYHFAQGAYVEYIGEVPEGDRKALVASLNTIAKDIIDNTPAEMTVFKKICQYDEANTHLAKAGGVPSYIPAGSDLRVLKLTEEDYGCPCGGTHVEHVRDIETLTIQKITKKGKSIQVRYVVNGST